MSNSEPIPQSVRKLKLSPLKFLLSRSKPLTLLEEVAKGAEDVVFVEVGKQRMVLLRDPVLIQKLLTSEASKTEKGRTNERALFFQFLGEGLLNASGTKHRKQRRLILPIFHRMRLKSYADSMVELTMEGTAHWETATEQDVGASMLDVALAIMGKTLFSSSNRETAAEITQGFKFLTENVNSLLMPGASWMQRMGIPPFSRLKQSQQKIEQAVRQIIAQRRDDPEVETKEDLLSMLIEAKDADDDSKGLSDNEIRDQIMTLLFTGQDPIGNTLSWFWWLMASHPEQQAKLQQEIDEVIGTRSPTFADIPNLRFTDQLLKETLRLYPAIWTMARRALEDLELNDVRVPADSLIVASQWLIHRDERWFKSPHDFLPDRWTSAFKEQLPRFAYFPFGGGARSCIGENFAHMEMLIVIATIAREWSFEIPQGSRNILPQARITLHPDQPIKLKLRRRSLDR